MASGVVVAERVAGRDLRDILADVIRPEGAEPGPAHRDQLAGSAHADGRPTSPSGHAEGTSPAPAEPGGPALEGNDDGSDPGSASSPRAARPAPGRGAAPGTSSSPGGSAGTAGSTEPGVADPGTGAGQQPATDPGVSAATALERTVSELQPFVESEAGLTFKAPVPIRILSDSEFRSRLDELNWLPAGAEAERLEGVYRSLGLIGSNVDVATELAKFTRSEVATLYDAVDGQLLIRSAEPSAYLRTRLVRELTRALDDQHFDIYRPTLDDPYDEARDGLKALAEGDAGRVHDRYVAGLPVTDRAQVEAERQRINRQTPANINPAVLARFGYAVNQGQNLVAALLSAGGRGRLNGAFAAPPTTSEQVLHPDRYLAGDGRRSVAEPGAAGAVEARGTLGEIGLISMLSGSMDGDTAARAALGWGGDRFVSWRQGNLTCTAMTIVTDTATDASELGDALRRWAAARGGAEVTGTGPYGIKRCA